MRWMEATLKRTPKPRNEPVGWVLRLHIFQEIFETTDCPTVKCCLSMFVSTADLTECLSKMSKDVKDALRFLTKIHFVRPVPGSSSQVGRLGRSRSRSKVQREIKWRQLEDTWKMHGKLSRSTTLYIIMYLIQYFHSRSTPAVPMHQGRTTGCCRSRAFTTGRVFNHF